MTLHHIRAHSLAVTLLSLISCIDSRSIPKPEQGFLSSSPSLPVCSRSGEAVTKPQVFSGAMYSVLLNQ